MLLKKLKSEKGSLAIAMVVAMFSLFSGLSLVFLGYKDSVGARLEFDAIQELHILRSEADRGLATIAGLGNTMGITLPSKTFKVTSNNSRHRRAYSVKTKIVKSYKYLLVECICISSQ